MKYVSNLDGEVSFESASLSYGMPHADASPALTNAALDENFPWHRIRRLSRK